MGDITIRSGLALSRNVPAVKAMYMTGGGNSMSGILVVLPTAVSVLPVFVFFSLGIATMSPGPALVSGVCFFPMTCKIAETLSFVSVDVFWTVMPGVKVPEMMRT